MKLHITVPISLLTAVLIAPFAAAQTPIFYNRAQNNGNSALFRMTRDGDTPINTGLNEAHQPTVSNGGRFIAVTAADGPNPGQLSQDVWVIDTVQGSTIKMIDNHDRFNRQTQASTTTRPIYKAFSPDGRAMAVSNVLQSTGGVVQGQTNGVSTIPQLMIYRTSDGFPIASVYLGQIRDGSLTELMGVDWLPQTGEVIAPAAVTVQRQGTGIPTNATAIFASAPITDAVTNGRVRQITNPRAWSTSNFAAGTVEYGHENDLFPASSPSGRKIAFFRSVDRLVASPQFNGTLPSRVSLRTINSDGSGEQVLWNFNEGQIPTGVSWSADGTRLVLGMGTQLFTNGTAFKHIDPATGQLLMIPSGGGDLTAVGTRGSANPVWASTNTGNSNTGGTNNNANDGGNSNTSGSNNSSDSNSDSTNSSSSSSTSAPSIDFIIKPNTASFILHVVGSNADPNASFLLQTSPDLENWKTSLIATGKMANSGITIANGSRQAYYRLVKKN